MIEEKTLKTLEYDKILNILSNYAVSEITRKEILNISPSFEISEVDRLLSFTEEACITKSKYNLSPIVAFDDVSEILDKARAGAILQMSELLKVARLIRSVRIAKKEISGTGEDIQHLKTVISSLFIETELEKIIVDSIAGENEMKDDASDALKSIRKKIKHTDSRLKEKLASYTRSGEISKYLQDNIVTVRNGRFVLPVKSECRGSVPGLIHDQSSTGATVFIEPFAVVELNNEIKSLKLEEAQEIERILKIISAMVSGAENRLRICFEIAIMLDIIYAKSEFSTSFNCMRPQLNTKGYVNLINARHPLIDKNKIVPVDVSFGKNYNLLLITGPNTGGKTVCLKTVGLFCLMACSGINIPCGENSEISIFDNIYCDMGDEQSILNSLSTFSSHIVNLIRITNSITNKSLVLLDELGGGTDPSEGAALAIGIIKYLELIGAKGILTTHYGELKEYALLSEKIKNGCMQFDEDTLKPTYKLILGIPGLSNALKIAKSLGLNDYIIDNAVKSLKEEKVQFELVLQNAENVKSKALKELNEINILKEEIAAEREALRKERGEIKEKLERININAISETRRIVSKNVEKAEEIIDEMKELIKSADEQALFKARSLKREIEDMNYIAEKSIQPQSYKTLRSEDAKVSANVIIKSLGTVGTIVSGINKRGEIEVSSGNAIIKLKLSDLAYVEESERKQKNKIPKKSVINSNNASSIEKAVSNVELRVLGHTVNEAIEMIYPHIMSDIDGILMLKIIHGKGTGALGRGIQNFLRSEPKVKSYRYGDYTEGGTGVTIAEIN